MRYLPGLVLALAVGAASSLYTPSVRAAGVYIGVGIPAPYYSGSRVWFSPGDYYGPQFWG